MNIPPTAKGHIGAKPHLKLFMLKVHRMQPVWPWTFKTLLLKVFMNHLCCIIHFRLEKFSKLLQTGQFNNILYSCTPERKYPSFHLRYKFYLTEAEVKLHSLLC